MRRVNICVVSDDGAVRDSIKDLVESPERDTLLFDSLEKYLKTADFVPCQCLVLDVHGLDRRRMSPLEGICATRPVILIADRSDLSLAVRGIQLGAADIVQKPYGNTQLLDAVKQAIADG